MTMGLYGCTPRAAVKLGYDFSKIRRVAVLDFAGAGGSAVADELIRQLLKRGVPVMERRVLQALLQEKRGQSLGTVPFSPRKLGERLGVEAVFTGSVTEYAPSQKFLVFLGSHQSVTPSGSPIVVTNPVVALSGSQITPQGTAFGLGDTQLVSVSATVGVSARMVEVESGSVLWADGYQYEGIDAQSAAQAVVASLVKSLQNFWPALQGQN